MAEQTTIGVEIDGGRVTVVEVSKGHAVNVRTVTGPSAVAALESLLTKRKQKRSDPPIRVLLAHPGIRMRRIDVTGQLTSRRNFEDAVYGSLNLPRDGSTTSGLFFHPEDLIGDTVSAGIGVIAPESPVVNAYKAAGKIRTEIVAPPVAHYGANGLWLAVRHDTADLTLVVDNEPVAYRQLPAGGLGNVLHRLGEDGENRMRAVLDGTGPLDPLAAAEIDLYLRQLAEEVTATADYFRREGNPVPNSLCVHGAGAHSGISRALVERGFVVEMPDWLSRRLMYLPVQDRESAVSAFFAAFTVGNGVPQSVFVNPDAARLAQELARRDRRAKVMLAGVGVLALITLIGVGPLARAWLDTRNARSELVGAQTRLDRYKTEDDLLRALKRREGEIKTLGDHHVDWVGALSALYDTLPPGARVMNLSASPDGGGVTVRASVESSGGYGELSAWLNTLTARYGNGSAWTGNFTDRDGLTSYDLVLTVAEADATTTTVPAAAPAGAPTTTSEAGQ